MNRSRIFEAFHRTRQPAAADFMPLAEAANALREALRGSDLDLMSRGLGQDEDSLLAFWAHQVAQIGVPVHGYRIMSTTLELIPDAAMLTGKVDAEATRLEPGGQQSVNDFGALQVRRQDLEAAIARLGRDGAGT